MANVQVVHNKKSIVAHVISGASELGQAVETSCRVIRKLSDCAEAGVDKSIEWVKEEKYLELGTPQEA